MKYLELQAAENINGLLMILIFRLFLIKRSYGNNTSQLFLPIVRR